MTPAGCRLLDDNKATEKVPTELSMKCCHSNLHRLALGLFCLTVMGCNGWQSATSPPQGRVNQTSIEITEQVDLSPPEPAQPDSSSTPDQTTDQTTDSQTSPAQNGVRALRPLL